MVCNAGNLTILMCRQSWNLEVSTSWNPQSLYRYCIYLYFSSHQVILLDGLQIFSVINQLNAQNIVFIIGLLYASTSFEHYVLIIKTSKLYYTASCIITPVDGRPVHRLREDSQSLHGKATYRCDDTRCCIIQFWPPDDEHILLEAFRVI